MVLMTILTILIILVGIIGLLLFAISRYLAKERDYWPRKGVVFVGSNALGINPLKKLFNPITPREFDGRIYDLCEKQNVNYVGLQEFSTPVLFCRDMEIIKNVLVKDFNYFTNKRNLSFAENDPHFCKMLVNMEGEEWKELRSKMSPTFTTGKIRKMFKIYDDSSRSLVKYIVDELSKSETGNLDLTDSFGRYTMDVISSSAFGVNSKTFEEKNSRFYEMGLKMRFRISAAIIIKFIFLVMFPKLAKLFGVTIGDQECDQFFTGIIKSVLKHRASTGEKRDDFLQLMIEARDGKLAKIEESELDTFEKEALISIDKPKGKITLDDDSIVAQSILFILAGYDTTSSLILFSAYQLALLPEIQDKLLQEVINAWKEGKEGFTYDAINHMEYMGMFINETLRMFPPFVRAERRCGQSYKIPETDIILEKDSMVFIPIYAIHHDEKHYPDPMKFDPERFSNENKAKRNPYAFMPFGHGPRNCIGMRFALMETKVALAHLIRNFVIEPCEKTLIPMKFSTETTTKPAGGMWLKLKTRD